jgi:hypothetical protein
VVYVRRQRHRRLSAVPHVPTQCRDCCPMPTSVETMKLIPLLFANRHTHREEPFHTKESRIPKLRRDAECTYLHMHNLWLSGTDVTDGFLSRCRTIFGCFILFSAEFRLLHHAFSRLTVTNRPDNWLICKNSRQVHKRVTTVWTYSIDIKLLGTIDVLGPIKGSIRYLDSPTNGHKRSPLQTSPCKFGENMATNPNFHRHF